MVDPPMLHCVYKQCLDASVRCPTLIYSYCSEESELRKNLPRVLQMGHVTAGSVDLPSSAVLCTVKTYRQYTVCRPSIHTGVQRDTCILKQYICPPLPRQLCVQIVEMNAVHCRDQCYGSMTFWCGSGSADPCLWLIDPDPDSDPDPEPGSGSCYFRHWPSRCQQKTNLKKMFFCLLLFEGTFTSFFKDKKSKRSHKTVGIKVFLTSFACW